MNQYREYPSRQVNHNQNMVNPVMQQQQPYNPQMQQQQQMYFVPQQNNGYPQQNNAASNINFGNDRYSQNANVNNSPHMCDSDLSANTIDTNYTVSNNDDINAEIIEKNVMVSVSNSVTDNYIKPKKVKEIGNREDIFNTISYVKHISRNIKEVNPLMYTCNVKKVIYTSQKFNIEYLQATVKMLGKVFDDATFKKSVPQEFDQILTGMFNNSFNKRLDSFIGDLGDFSTLIKGAVDEYTESILTLRNIINEFIANLTEVEEDGVFLYTFYIPINIIINNTETIEDELTNVTNVETEVLKKSVLARQVSMINNGGNTVLIMPSKTYLVSINMVSVIKGV